MNVASIENCVLYSRNMYFEDEKCALSQTSKKLSGDAQMGWLSVENVSYKAATHLRISKIWKPLVICTYIIEE